MPLYGLVSSSIILEATGLIQVISDSGVVNSFNPTADTDSARGTALIAAVAAATAGQTIVLNPAVYALGNSVLTLGADVDLRMDSGAVITSTRSDVAGVPEPIVTPGNNSVIRGGKIYGTVTNGEFQAPFGVMGTAKTGWVLDGTILEADTDGIYVVTAGSTGTINDCEVIAKYDAIVSQGAATSLDCHNTRITVVGPTASGVDISRGLVVTSGGTIRYYGGKIAVSEGGADTNAGAYATGANSRIELHNVAVRTSNTGLASPYDVLNTGTGSPTVTVGGGSGSNATGTFVTSGTVTYAQINARPGAFTTLSASGAALFSDGTAGAPSIGWTSDADGSGTGIYRRATNQIAFSNNGALTAYFTATNLVFSTGVNLLFNETYIRRPAAQSLQVGAPDSATPLANTLTIGESSRSGTDSNVAGGNGIIASGTGTGTGAVSSLIFQTPTVAGAGTGAQTLATRLTISSSSVLSSGLIEAGTNVRTASTGHFMVGSRARMDSPADGKLRVQPNGATTGVILDASTDGLLNVQNFAATGPGRVATAAQSATLAAAATTLAVTSNVVNLTGDAGANTLATITGGVSGMRLTIIFTDGNVTITDTDAATADTVNLSAALTGAANTVLDLVHNGTKWMEVSRSVNG